MRLTRFALANPVAVVLVFLAVGCAGLLGWSRMGRSILPDVALPVVTVSAPYAGAGSREIETLIVAPLEDTVRAMSDVERVSSFAEDGVASIVIRFRFGTDIDADVAAVQRAADAARPNLPPDLVPPQIAPSDPSQAPVLEESITSALLTHEELSDLAQHVLAPGLRTIGAIGSVRVSGDTVAQLIVRPKRAALAAVGATPLDLYRAVASANDVLPGGRTDEAGRESTVAVRTAADGVRALREVPVSAPGEASVRVRDVADVVRGRADPVEITRVDGERAVMISVVRARGASGRDAIAAARRGFAQFARRYPLVRFQAVRTDELTTDAATAGVVQTLGEGIVLTVLVVFVFLRAWRNAAIAAIAIPSSLCAAVAVMWAAGFTVNVLSLMGLSVTIGILVDDSIVIIEAIARAIAQGARGDAAALAGRDELGAATLAITLVDVAVFAPLGLTSGIVGEFMREFALAIVFSTAFSLLVSFTLTPLLMARWASAHAEERVDVARLPWTLRSRGVLAAAAAWQAVLRRINGAQTRLERTYARVWLPAAMRRRRTVLAAAGAACVASLAPVLTAAVPAEFTPPISDGRVRVSVQFPAGTPLALTDARLNALTARLLDDDAIRHVVVTSGRTFNGVADVVSGDAAQLTALIDPARVAPDAVVARVKALQVPGAAIAGSGRGMGGTAPIAYTITGDPSAVDESAQRVAAVLRENPDAEDVRTSDAGFHRRVDVAIDPARALVLGVSTDDAAQVARIVSGGTLAMRVRSARGLEDVVVRDDAVQRGDLDALQRSAVRTASGTGTVPLGALDVLTRSQEPEVIEHENGSRIVTVTANTRRGAPIGLVTGPTARRISGGGILLPATRLVPRGDIEQLLDAVTRIGAALAISLAAVYAILAILYRSYGLPLVIMSTVPLAAVGAFGTLALANALHAAAPDAELFRNETLNLYSMLGTVMLVGLVAKNGILLVEFAERAVRRGATRTEAIVEAAERRFRPIVMTTFAMIAGTLPLALGHTAGAEARKALGTVVVGGLTSSLLLTLFVVPLVYVRASPFALRPPTSSG